jgi:serine/threonine-protein kinase HipA
MLSLRTLCRERSDYTVDDYSALASAVRKHVRAPEKEVAALFRQAVFNMAVGNTDDHLKNFWLVRNEAGWELSPAFDLLPDVAGNREHTLRLCADRLPPCKQQLIELGSSWGVKKPGVVVEEVCEAVNGFDEVARALDVPERDVTRFASDIAWRVKALNR